MNNFSVIFSGMNKGQSFFSILLKDVGENPILINQLLVDCGWAELFSSVILDDFEVLLTEYEDDMESLSDAEKDEIEKIKEIVETSKTVSSSEVVPKTFKSANHTFDQNNLQNMEENNDLEFFCGSGDEIDNFIDFMNAVRTINYL